MTRLPLDARLLVRVPGLAGAVAAVLARSSPGSPLRRRLLSRVVKLGFRLENRWDFEQVARLMYEPDSELRLHGYEAMGLPERYLGRAGVVTFLDDWEREIGASTWTPREVVDLGDRVLVRVELTGAGRASGATVRHTTGWLFHLSSGGRIAVHDFYWRWPDALEAVGPGH